MPKIALYYYPQEGYGLPDCWHDPLRYGMDTALAALGWEAEHRKAPLWEGEIEPVDAVACWSIKGRRADLMRAYGAAGIPSILLEMGTIARNLGTFHLGLGPDLYWIPEQVPAADRLGDVLGITVKARSGRLAKNAPIIVLGQLDNDSQHGMSRAELQGWATDTIAQIRQVTNRPIIWRPHPIRWEFMRGPFGADSISYPETQDLASAIKSAYAVVTYNSTSGWQALASGIPVVCNPLAAYSSIAITDVAQLAKPVWDRDAIASLMHRLAYATWTREELDSGAPLQFLSDFGYLQGGNHAYNAHKGSEPVSQSFPDERKAKKNTTPTENTPS